jgi:NADH-quinone oxidoreductase subunit C
MDIRTPVPTIYGDFAKKHMELWRKQVQQLSAAIGAAVEEVRWPGEAPVDVPVIYVARSKLCDAMRLLKEQESMQYDFLSDITATDEEIEPRFEVVYNLASFSSGARIRVKVRVREGESVPTLVGLWDAANWVEREVWDMFGIRFEGHPDLRRILMDERWEGHPLRKDYPLRGYQLFPDPMPIQVDLLKD